MRKERSVFVCRWLVVFWSVLLLLVFSGTVRAGHYTVTWTNGNGTGLWSEGGNWDGGQVPLNGADTFDVVIPDNFTVYYDVDGAGFITDMDLAENSVLIINPGHSLTVLDDVYLAGKVQSDGNNTSFICNSAGVSLGDGAKLSVANGATISCNAASYSSKTINDNVTLFSADGYNSRLNLSSLQNLDARSHYAYRTYTISATNYGVIDMSWLGTMYGASGGTSKLKFVVSSNGFINLYYLTDILGGRTTFDIDVPVYSLPSLRTAIDTTFDISGVTELNLPKLEAVDSCSFVIPDGGKVNAPQLTSFNHSQFELRPGISFVTGTLANIDNAQFVISGGEVFGFGSGDISATSYSSVGLNGNYTIFSAAGSGTVLDLSCLTSIDGAFPYSYKTHTISATDGGKVDLSAVESIRGSGNYRSQLKFFVDNGGVIDLGSLREIPYGYTAFDINTVSFALPKLVSVNGVIFDVSGASTVNLPKLETMVNSSVVIEDGGVFNAPLLSGFINSQIDLNPTRGFVAGTLSNIDNSRFAVSGGKIFGFGSGDINATSYSSVGLSGNYTIFSAAGSGTVLDLSCLTSIDGAFTNSYRTHTISATDGGKVDLSAVESIRGSSNYSSQLKFFVDSGGVIDLGSLREIPYGHTTFDINTGVFGLPELLTATGTTFDAAGGTTINLPGLTSLTGGSIVIEDGGTISAPVLTSLTNSELSLNPSRIFTTGKLANIDNTRFTLAGGQKFGTAYGDINAGSYTSAGLGGNSTFLISVTGVGTVMDLSSLSSFEATFTNAYRTHIISVADNAVLNLSGLGILKGAVNPTSKLEIDVDSGAKLHFGNGIDISGHTEINISGTSSEMIVNGGLTLKPDVKLDVSGGGLLRMGGDFVFNTTDAAACQMDAGTLQFIATGAGGAVMEVGGAELGIGGAHSGNFGIGTLMVGDGTTATTVSLVDLVDNGNRSGGGREALYLYGNGGQGGLKIGPGSKLIIGDINVYAYVGGQMVHINSLFGPGVKWVAFDQGTITLSDYDCALRADLNGDCYVDLNDLAIMASEWLQCGDMDCP